MSFRDDIMNSALNWPDPGQYKPTASELVSLFTDSSTQQAPSQDEAQRSLDRLGTGCYIGAHADPIFAPHSPALSSGIAGIPLQKREEMWDQSQTTNRRPRYASWSLWYAADQFWGENVVRPDY